MKKKLTVVDFFLFYLFFIRNIKYNFPLREFKLGRALYQRKDGMSPTKKTQRWHCTGIRDLVSAEISGIYESDPSSKSNRAYQSRD